MGQPSAPDGPALPGGEPLATGSFFGSVERQWRSPLVTLSSVRHRERRRVPAHAHAHAFVTLLLRGGYEEEAEGQRIVYAPMGLVYHSAGLVHRDEIHDGGADFFTIELAPAFLGGRLRRKPGLRSLRDLSGGPAVWRALRLLEAFQSGETAGLAFEEWVAELLDELAGLEGGDARSEPGWLPTVDAALEQRWHEPLTLGGLAGEVRVHPVHLSRVFRRWRGRTLRDTLRGVRLREACRLLQEGMPLAELALATGFVDQSHLSNVFRRVTGLTPGTTRRLLGEAAAPVVQGGQRMR